MGRGIVSNNSAHEGVRGPNLGTTRVRGVPDADRLRKTDRTCAIHCENFTKVKVKNPTQNKNNNIVGIILPA